MARAVWVKASTMRPGDVLASLTIGESFIHPRLADKFRLTCQHAAELANVPPAKVTWVGPNLAAPELRVMMGRRSHIPIERTWQTDVHVVQIVPWVDERPVSTSETPT